MTGSTIKSIRANSSPHKKSKFSGGVIKNLQHNTSKLLLLLFILLLSKTAFAVLLTNNSVTTGISGALDSTIFYTIDVPTGATNLSIDISGANGDADLYVKFGSAPSLTVYDYRPYLNGSNETVNIASPSTGTYHIMIHGYAAYSALTLSVSYDEPVITALSGNPATAANLAGTTGSETRFSFDVPAGATSLVFDIAGIDGDADLYVKFGEIATLTVYDFRPYIGGSNETVSIPAPSVGTYHIMIHGYSAYTGVTLTASFVDQTAIVIPPDPNGFLQFFNKTAPRNAQNAADGDSYYRAIDPNNLRLTFADFKAFNNNLSSAENAVYVNDADLGFGRRMYLTENADGTIASCVENFAPLNAAGAPNVNAAASEKLALAKTGNPADIVATVCMEFSGTPGSGTTAGALVGRKYVKFFSYIGDGTRITQADLDGRGLKTQPGLCNTCHGGQGNSVTNGVYPNNGDTGAQFLPWDLDTFVYDTEAGFTRADLEPLLKRFNVSVLTTYPEPANVFSFQGNVVIPATADANTGVFGSAPITVTGVTDIVTSITITIDTDTAGGPGLSHQDDLRDSAVYLIPPVGSGKEKIRLINTRFATNRISSGNPVLGFSNVFMNDIAASASGTGLTNVNGILSGVLMNTSSMVLDPSCSPATTNVKDFACIVPNGEWRLEVENLNTLGSATISAWSIHFNGIPREAYTPTPVDMIQGWYASTPGDTTLSRATFNGSYVPEGWLDANNSGAVASTSQLYLEVIGPTCRACHAQRGTYARNEISFSSYDDFMIFADRTKSLVFDQGLMPLAKRTFESHFWNGSQPSTLALHMTGLNAGDIPGRNIADAGIARIGDFSVAINSVVNLNGRNSIFPESFSWTVTLGTTAIAVTGANTATPSFTPSTTGLYTVTLDTAGGNGGAATVATIDVNVVAVVTPVSFRNDIIDKQTDPTVGTNRSATMRSCGTNGGCHQQSNNQGPLLNIPINIPAADLQPAIDEVFRIVRDRSDLFNPNDSFVIRKNIIGEYPHEGAIFRAVDPFDTSTKNLNLMIRWMLEGAPNN